MSSTTSRRTRRRSAAAAAGFGYLRRPDPRASKKSGNLRWAFARTAGEFLLILDADFAPRPDFLAETLPYMDDPAVAIVQTPQFFRGGPGQTWIESAAGAIQEVFYRSVQVARDRLGAAICVGTSAVYRRAALAPQGGPTLMPYAEDVHTGLDVRRAGWSLRYLPVVLSAGICPDNLDAFVRQQYRWCTGNAGVVFSRRLWSVPMSIPARLTYISGFFYYAYTGLLTFFGPIIPVVMLAFLPGQVQPAELRHPAPGGARAAWSCTRSGIRPAYGPARLGARHCAWLGSRLRDLGRRPGQDNGLAPVPDPGQCAAPVPPLGHRLERRHGPGVDRAGPVADGQPGTRPSPRSCSPSAC